MNNYYHKLEKLLVGLTPAMLVLVLGLSAFSITPTGAFYNDGEVSADNNFSASRLDFQLTNNNLTKIIGPEAQGEVLHTSVVMPESGSLPMQYILTNNILNEDAGLCAKLTVEAKLNGISKYFGPLSGLLTATTTEFGTWEFNFDLPPLTVAAQDDRCQGEAIFQAWRADTPEPAQSGFTDDEKITFAFTARMVVLNEIFAHPAVGGVAPEDKEYIELYNNGNTPVDVLGWRISEMSGTSTENLHAIVASGAVAGQLEPYAGAPTIIAPGGFLVLRFGGAATYLNDSGDTVKLHDSGSVLLDAHSYPAVAAGKAVVRFPDGIGFWVDPEPTPGTTNTVSLDDLRLAGFTDEQIAEVLELALLKNVTLLDKLKIEEKLDPSLATSTATTTAIATTTSETNPVIVPLNTGTTTATSTATTTSETDPATGTEDGSATGSSSPAEADDNPPTGGGGSGSETTDLPPALIPEVPAVVGPPDSSEPVPPAVEPVGEPAPVSEPAPAPEPAPDLPVNAVEPTIN